MEGDRCQTAAAEGHPDGAEGPVLPQAGEAEASQREAADRPGDGRAALRRAAGQKERRRRSGEEERTRQRRRQRTKSPGNYRKVIVS